MKRLLFLSTLLSFTLLWNACQPDDPVLCDPTPKFNIDVFVANIKAEMDDVSGYALVVNENGNLYHAADSGKSIYAGDPGGEIDMTVDTRMNVASVSKFIGTIAMMQVLEKHNISIEQPIYNYLPESWKPAVHGDHFDAGSAYRVSFRNMMRMETGIQFAASGWSPGPMPTTATMRTALRSPADPARWGVYQNGNFTLIRVLIGEIEYNLDENDTNYDLNCADAYFDYIKTNIFDPLNLSPPMSITAVNNYYAGNFTRAHQWPFNPIFQDGNNNVGWGATSNPQTNGGSGGLVLSAIDLAKVLAYFIHDDTETIISAAQRTSILDHELGLTESTDGVHGRYQSKGGTRGPENGTSRALRSRVMFLPGGVEVVILSNCNITTLGTILRQAYDDAWVNPC